MRPRKRLKKHREPNVGDPATLARLEKRISSRRWAEECYGAADDPAAFAERVMELAGINMKEGKPERPRIVPMTDQEAKAFEKTLLFFGQFKGKIISDVPLSYLQRLVDPPSEEMREFLERVRRYLLSPAIRQLMEEGAQCA